MGFLGKRRHIDNTLVEHAGKTRRPSFCHLARPCRYSGVGDVTGYGRRRSSSRDGRTCLFHSVQEKFCE